MKQKLKQLIPFFAILLVATTFFACDEAEAEADEPATEEAEEVEEASADEQAEDEGAAQQANTASVALDIDGMTCVSCANSIKASLLEAEGIISADLDFGARRADVEYDADRLDVEAVIAIIEADDSGFTATEAGAGDES